MLPLVIIIQLPHQQHSPFMDIQMILEVANFEQIYGRRANLSQLGFISSRVGNKARPYSVPATKNISTIVVKVIQRFNKNKKNRIINVFIILTIIK